MKRIRCPRFLRILGTLSLAALSAILFNGYETSPRLLLAAVCLTLFASIVLDGFIAWIDADTHYSRGGGWNPPVRSSAHQRPPSTGSGKTSDSRTTPLPPPSGDARKAPPPVSLTLTRLRPEDDV